MKQTSLIITSVCAIAAGAGLIIAADRLGVLSPDEHDHASHQQPAARPQPLVRSTALTGSSQIEVVSLTQPQANTLETPRSQRAPAETCAIQNQIIRFADESVAARAGLTFATARRQSLTRTLQCNAELVFDGDRFAHISPRASGVIHRVEKRLGDRVKAGETLVIIDSPDVGAAKAEYLQAIAAERLWRSHLERQSLLADSGDTSRRDLLEAETQCAQACILLSRTQQRLKNLGVTVAAPAATTHSHDEAEHDSASINLDAMNAGLATSADDSLLHVTAPFDGIVVDRHAVLGEVVDTEHVLFSIAGVKGTEGPRLWMMMDIYEHDAAAVTVGQRVSLHVAGMEDDPVVATISWISPQVDPRTRTLKARADVDNANGSLRANMFGVATITIHDREELLVVPRSAVQWEGCCNVVFIKQSDTEFQPRKVRLGYETNGWCVIRDGVKENDVVVNEGSFLLKTEVLKGSIGAGCCADH